MSHRLPEAAAGSNTENTVVLGSPPALTCYKNSLANCSRSSGPKGPRVCRNQSKNVNVDVLPLRMPRGTSAHGDPAQVLGRHRASVKPERNRVRRPRLGNTPSGLHVAGTGRPSHAAPQALESGPRGQQPRAGGLSDSAPRERRAEHRQAC